MYPTRVREPAVSLLAQGLTLSDVSRRLGVSRAAIRDWHDNGTGRASSHECPADPGSKEYAALLGYCLGDGCISLAGGVYSLRVSCDRTWPGIIDDVEARIRAVHPSRPVHRIRAPGVVVVQNHWKHWPCLFEDQPADFLRGLFHSDGARVRNWATRVVAGERRRYDYPRWQFVNCSSEIRTWCCEALDLVGVEWRQSNHKTISVSRRASVARLDTLIGPKGLSAG